MKNILILVSVLSFPTISIAVNDFDGSGNGFVKSCNAYLKLEEARSVDNDNALLSINDAYHGGNCVGMILGMLALADILIDAARKENFSGNVTPFCPPSDNDHTVKIITSKVVKYLNENPKQRNKPNIYALVTALQQLFPCQ